MKRRTIQPRMRRRRKAKAAEYRAASMKRMERKVDNLARAIRAFSEAFPEAPKQWSSIMQSVTAAITEWAVALRQKQVEEADNG